MSPRMPARMLARQSDARLLELHRKGDTRAFEAIVRRYRRELLAYCGRLGLSDARAEDALQQAFINAWLSLQQGTEVRELHAWLRRIVHNTALNLIRGGGRAVDLDPALLDAASATESSLAQTMSAREALADVAALPPMQRDAMVLSAIEGRSHDEVASALGVTPIAVRGLLYRARATLRAGAAALTPAPLFSWASQAASRLACWLGLVSGPSVGGEGFNLGRALLEGAAVVATAALAAGAVLGHSHAHRSAPRQAPRALARVEAPSRPSVQARAVQPPQSSSSARTRSIAAVPVAGRTPGGAATTVTAPAKRSPASQPVASPGASSPAAGPSAPSTGESPRSVASVASGPGSGAGEPPARTESSGTTEGKEGSDEKGSEEKGSSDEGEAAREAEEEAAEKRTELQEHEAEHERELAEREAEKAREAREEETDH